MSVRAKCARPLNQSSLNTAEQTRQDPANTPFRGFNYTLRNPTELPLSASTPSRSSISTPNLPRHGPLLPRRRYAPKNPRPNTHLNPTNLQPPELINIHTAFHAGAYQQVLDFDTSPFSAPNALPARILKLRAQIALGGAKDVAAELSGEKTPDLVAVRLLAEYETGKDVLAEVKKLAEQQGQENLTVQLCAGMVLERAGETEEALSVLSKHQGSLDA